MPRPRFRREPCDCLDCTEPLRQAEPVTASIRHAAALQDPPPKCLVIFIDGALRPSSDSDAVGCTSLDDVAHPHLDGLARDGCSGLLAVQTPPADEVREPFLDRLAQLFSVNAAARVQPSTPPNLASRYKQLAAAFASDSTDAVELGRWAGFQQSFGLSELVARRPNTQPALSDLPAPQAVAAAALDLLGLHSGTGTGSAAGKAAPAPQAGSAAERGGEDVGGDEGEDALDLLMLHLSADSLVANDAAEQCVDAAARVVWLDEVVRYLNAAPGVQEGLLLAVLLGSDGAPLPGQLLVPGGGGGSTVGAPRPRQSWQLRDDKAVSVQADAPLLAVQRLPAVVRVDACLSASLRQCAAQGGNNVILAERLLPELAYKLGRAPKYGA